MKKNDLLFVGALVLFFGAFFVSEQVLAGYKEAIKNHELGMSFLQFAVLCTLGEVLGLRIAQGVYTQSGFGILPRALFWGFMGVFIHTAFVVFATGVPFFADHFIGQLSNQAMIGGLSADQLLKAFLISLSLNVMFAPVFMTVHAIANIHITESGGTLRGFFSPVDIGGNLKKLDWSVMWGFVFKKTLPRFWLPAHTITFLLPPNYRILYAAFLGIALGLILAFASMKKSPKVCMEATA